MPVDVAASKKRNSHRERTRAGESARPSSLEEERREVLESVFHAMETERPDRDRAAAWLHLLRHLNRPSRLG
jgi:hypothetical protein